MIVSTHSDQVIAEMPNSGTVARMLRATRRAASGFLAFLGDAIVQLAVEDVCMAFVTATVSAVVGLQIAA